ncbi:PQQ-binding-like beta-propeller repeat protein [bacterium]|nr:PQQ-binding-like beta-propeller repeat protein [bacterium]
MIWKAQLPQNVSGKLELFEDSTLVISGYGSGTVAFDSSGKLLYSFAGKKGNENERFWVRHDDQGNFYRRSDAGDLNRTGGNRKPPPVMISRHDRSGRELWQKQSADLSGFRLVGIDDNGLLFHHSSPYVPAAFSLPETDNDGRYVNRLIRTDAELNILSKAEFRGPDLTYRLSASGDGNILCTLEDIARKYDSEGRLLWEHVFHGFRREAVATPDGSIYAQLKSPDRLVKLGSDGLIEWECLLNPRPGERAPNDYYDFGHVFGSYLARGSGGNVYCVTAYGELLAIDSDGAVLWRTEDSGDGPDEAGMDLSFMEYQTQPAASSSGLVGVITGSEDVRVLDAEGRTLFVDVRFHSPQQLAFDHGNGLLYVQSAGWVYALDPADLSGEPSFEEQTKARQQELARTQSIAQESDSGIDSADGDIPRPPDPDMPPEHDEPGLADRTEVAAIIIDALEAFHADKGQYPSHLRGVRNPDDPLISEGYLKAYPKIWPQISYFDHDEFPNMDDEGVKRWYCAVATPGYCDETLTAELSIIRDRSIPIRVPCLSAPHMQHDFSAYSYFGYQRGDWMGSDADEAWLWFYGSNIWPENNNPIPEERSDYRESEYYDLFFSTWIYADRGLDLLNPLTGELEPDGKPDGICLLYHLKNGKVEEVLRAVDL